MIFLANYFLITHFFTIVVIEQTFITDISKGFYLTKIKNTDINIINSGRPSKMHFISQLREYKCKINARVGNHGQQSDHQEVWRQSFPPPLWKHGTNWGRQSVRVKNIFEKTLIFMIFTKNVQIWNKQTHQNLNSLPNKGLPSYADL